MPWRSNSALHNAKKWKKDEFYTQLVDIDKELCNYKHYFKDKIIFCNCDDPYESNFFKYFAANFNFLWLKKLIATWYSTSPIAFTQLPLFEVAGYEWQPNRTYKIEINEVYDANGDWAINLSDIEYLLKTWKWKNKLTLLKWDGDFRSQESINLLKQCDIVVTNPPFSLFREYVAQLMEYNKKFLIIWNQNALTYKEIFPYIINDKIWRWLTMNWSNRYFEVPDDYPLTEKTWKIENWKKYAFVKGVRWYTNLETKRRKEWIILYKKYNSNDYPKYDNYNAINIDKVSDIPCDYDWVMWVPITFLDKYNPNQFEILWTSDNWIIDDKYKITQWLTQKFVDDYYKAWWTWTYKEWNPTAWYYDNWIAKMSYKRLFIRRKK